MPTKPVTSKTHETFFMHTKHLLLARITLQLLHQQWPMASMSWAGSLCWREAVARSAQARFLFWREVVVRSFSPGQISAGVEWWLVQPRSCPSAGTKQLLTWPRPGPSAGAKRSFVLSVQAGSHLDVPTTISKRWVVHFTVLC